MKVENYRGNHKHVSKASPLATFGNSANIRRQAEIDAVAEERQLSVAVRGNSTAVLNQFVRGWE